MNYFDTSALVKLFVEEAGSEIVDELFARGGPVATARVAAAEAHAAFARRWRDRSISERDFLRLRRDFDRDWPALVRVDVTEEVVRRTRDLVRRHPLRGYDAVHLAAALELAAELETAVTFVTADERLGAAALAERMTVVDPELLPVSLAPGARLGPYEIVAPLGAGGMGEVYRAKDSRLGREVAVKVLPAEVANDPERLRRFELEARAASAIHHPNLLTVFDLGNQDGVAFLVTELLSGESLRELMGRGPLPPKRALELAIQYAKGLAAAHEQGIVHRDLKPENLFVTRDGLAKILDFGLARIDRPELAGASLQDASTVFETSAGTVLGTVGYMAPEQVRGERADARSDLFSFGVVLHELLAGANPFRRASVIESLNAILKEEPPELGDTPSGANPALVRVVGRLLEKEPARRFRSAHDLVFALEGLGETASAPSRTVSGAAAPSAARRRWLVPLGALALVAAGALGGRLLHSGRPAAPADTIRFQIQPPAGTGFRSGNAERHDFALSPDGGVLAFSAADQGTVRLYLRNLNDPEPRPLDGTEGAGSPFWSPDGDSLGFFAGGKLKRIAKNGGPAQVICEVQGTTTAAWGSAGKIVFTQAFGPNNGLFRVAAGGGAPERIEPVGMLPRLVEFLPDGRRFLYWDRSQETVTGKLFLRDIEGGEAKLLLDVGSQARYAAPGWLLYVRSGALVAQRFDAGAARLSGDPIPIASDIPYFFNGWSTFTVASGGRAIAYQKNPPPPPLTWFDRNGRELGRVGAPARHLTVRLSPDGKHAVTSRQDPASSFTDLWIVDLERGGATRFSDEPLLEWSPVWSPDGQRIAYTALSQGPTFTVTVRDAVSAAKLAETAHSSFFWPRAWTAGGLFLDRSEPRTNWDLWRWRQPGSAAPESLLVTDFSESLASPSPDGRWLAFFSQESGSGEIELAPLDAPGRRIRLSSGAGGTVPRWRADSRELFYVSADGWLTSIRIGDGTSPEIGAPEPLFEVDFVNEDSFDVSADGQRFLVANTKPTSELPITVVLDWQAELAKN